ncbi:MAG: hypothetical protein IKC43_02095 [Clostridia bacterium]|nr:hypothetical protein [Clostridia bacterium]
MNREQIVAHMQKPARILRTFCSIFFWVMIVATVIGTVMQLALPALAESFLSLLDSPQVEQTQEVREAIALFRDYADLPTYVTVTMAIFLLADGITSILMFLFLKRLFASLAEERYSILRTEYANGVQSVAIMMLVSAGIEFVFPVVIELMASNASTLIEGSSGMLIPGLVLLAIATIYRHACRLQLLNEQEAYDNFRASESGNPQNEEAQSYVFEEEKQEKQEEKPPFEGF